MAGITSWGFDLEGTLHIIFITKYFDTNQMELFSKCADINTVYANDGYVHVRLTIHDILLYRYSRSTMSRTLQSCIQMEDYKRFIAILLSIQKNGHENDVIKEFKSGITDLKKMLRCADATS